MAPPFRYRTLWIAVGWAMVAAVIVLSLMPNPPGLAGSHGDKYGHIAAYLAMMAWFAQITLVRRDRQRIACALVGLGVALEFAQSLTGYRSFEIADMAADALGVALGWLASPPRLPHWLLRLDARI